MSTDDWGRYDRSGTGGVGPTSVACVTRGMVGGANWGMIWKNPL